jgi:F-type H+-transporting ATPase subunit a
MIRFIAPLAALVPAAAFASGYTFIGQLEHSLHIKQHVVTFALVSVLFVLMGVVYRAKLSSIKNNIIPDRGITFRNIFEALVKKRLSATTPSSCFFLLSFS